MSVNQGPFFDAARGLTLARATFAAPAALLAALTLSACDRGPSNAYVAPPPAEVTVAAPVAMIVSETVDATGSLRGVESVAVRARVRGFIASRTVQGGERVRKGELLFTIDARPFEAAVARARAELESKRVALRLADLEVVRIQELVRQGASTQREADQRIATRDAARADVDLAEANLRLAELDLEWTTVTAPISGRVNLGPPPDVGELVGQNEPTLLCTIVDDSRLYATYTLDEGTYQGLRRARASEAKDDAAVYPVRMGLIDDAGYPFLGAYSHADNRVNPETGAITLEAVFDNPTGALMPGLYVRLQVLTGERPAILVPEVAVQQDQRGRYVLVVGQGDVVERRDVRIGRAVDDLRVVEDGLGGEERVVVNGVQRARPGATVVARAAAAAPAVAGAR